MLPLALLAGLSLFISGYCSYTFNKSSVSLIEIETIEEYFRLPLASLAVAVTLYWGHTQYILKFGEVRIVKVLVTLLIYGVGLFLILALDVIAFKLGRISGVIANVNGELYLESICYYFKVFLKVNLLFVLVFYCIGLLSLQSVLFLMLFYALYLVIPLLVAGLLTLEQITVTVVIFILFINIYKLQTPLFYFFVVTLISLTFVDLDNLILLVIGSFLCLIAPFLFSYLKGLPKWW